MEALLQQIINGVSLGSLYALIAIGYTMVYGVLRLINFAHGDVMMMGAYFGFFLITGFSLVGLSVMPMPWYAAFAVAIFLTALLGFLIERLAYRPLRSFPKISVLMTAIGVSFFLENLGLVVFGGRPKGFPVPEPFERIYYLGDVSVPILGLWIPLITLLSLAALFYLVYRTKSGIAMRAISRDVETPKLMGIDVNRVISLTFVVGSALAAVGGVMLAMRYPQINPLMGIMPGIKAFTAAVLGGIGNVAGAALGGLLLGFIEIFFVALLPDYAGYRDAIAFFILIFILLARPGGIMGEKLPD
ncbi:MAG: branched-chain amino acid ABC transporter permease [Deltaproteobacteria bacterium]